SFRLAAPGNLAADQLNGAVLSESGPRLVFVDGVFNEDLSSAPAANGSAGNCLVCTSLAAAMKSPSKAIEEHLGRLADARRNAFVALNTAFLRDGAFIEIPAGLALEKPVHVIHARSEGAEGTATHPRTLVIAGREAQATVIESYIGAAKEAYFTNAVTEVVAGENASVEHVKIQLESEAAFHTGTVQALQARSSRFHSYSVSLGARLARHDINTILAGEGGECTLCGLYQVSGKQHVDHHTRLDHAMPHCSSREYYRGILDGKSTGVFNGAIIVRKDAQKTDAIQSNKNLLLSDDAVINTKPELQILADDVRCTHGATIGQLNADAIFYLRARGIGLEAARRLLTRAFASDVISRIGSPVVREFLEAKLLARLSEGWKAKEVV
ncbi:MAG: Fe-S cluster assembly protein SufD, partial [Acidobacteriota bacterium]|nr:Fe-S cluster assembly protein SufD [Acidobacteriota bacterium]